MNSSRRHDPRQQPAEPESPSKKRGRDDFDELRHAMQAMETTFITIHDLTRDANILYSSQSITDVLDWHPEDVVGRPCWDFFHPDEVAIAQDIHGHGVHLDKASVLNYCRIKNKHGEWIGCECVFTIVYNVLIGCTSVYIDGPKAKKRAIEAPVVRKLFSSSPRDPRYHMLEEISSKFRAGPEPHIHEPRAALFLNRFTRTLTINFATNGLQDLLGISADELQGKSFYYCIQENCLAEAVRCLESAKANDSIAYLRFWYRDPRSDEVERHEEILGGNQESESDEKDGSLMDIEIRNESEEDDDEDDEEGGGGVRLAPALAPEILIDEDSAVDDDHPETRHHSSYPSRNLQGQVLMPGSRVGSSTQSSSRNTDSGQYAASRVFDQDSNQVSSSPGTIMSLESRSASSTPHEGRTTAQRARTRPMPSVNLRREGLELEAVISCTSDGLVVVIRAARPFVPNSVRVSAQYTALPYSNGLFASPWATRPHSPSPPVDPASMAPSPRHAASPLPYGAHVPAQANYGDSTVNMFPASGDGNEISASSPRGPLLVDVINSIREVVVFAWALTGINGSLEKHGRGRRLVGSVPQTGLPIWVREDAPSTEQQSSVSLVGNTSTDHGIGGQFAGNTIDSTKYEDRVMVREDGAADMMPHGSPRSNVTAE